MQQLRLWCPACRDYRLMAREGAPHGWGCLLTLLTGGLFLPVWVLLGLAADLREFRCQSCGAEYSAKADPYHVHKRAKRRRMVRSLGRPFAAFARVVRSLPAGAAAAYRALPEWAAPIVWGLGGAVPLLAAALAWRLFG